MSYRTYSNLLVSAEESDDDEVLLKMKSLTLDQSIVNTTNNKEAAQAIACAIDKLPHNKVEAQLLSMRRLPFLRRNLRAATDRLAAQLSRSSLGASQNKEELASRPYKDSYPAFQVEYILGSLHIRGYHAHGWRCPLCRILRTTPFSSKAGLDLHLLRSHPECNTISSHSKDVSVSDTR